MRTECGWGLDSDGFWFSSEELDNGLNGRYDGRNVKFAFWEQWVLIAQVWWSGWASLQETRNWRWRIWWLSKDKITGMASFKDSFCVYGCFPYMYAYVVCMCSAQEEDTGSVGTGVTEHGELCGCWEPTLGHLQDLQHPELLSQPSRPWLGGLKHYLQFDGRRISPRHLKVTSYVKFLTVSFEDEEGMGLGSKTW